MLLHSFKDIRHILSKLEKLDKNVNSLSSLFFAAAAVAAASINNSNPTAAAAGTGFPNAGTNPYVIQDQQYLAALAAAGGQLLPGKNGLCLSLTDSRAVLKGQH